jgi:hypothetical protein
VIERDAVDRVAIRAADLAEDHRRRDRPTDPIIQKAHDLTRGLQGRDVPARKIRSIERTCNVT